MTANILSSPPSYTLLSLTPIWSCRELLPSSNVSVTSDCVSISTPTESISAHRNLPFIVGNTAKTLNKGHLGDIESGLIQMCPFPRGNIVLVCNGAERTKFH